MIDHIKDDVSIDTGSISSNFEIIEVDYDKGTVLVEATKDEILINPLSGKPYFKIPEEAWNDEWKAGNVMPIPNI